jgi:hypothetical protein
MLFVLGFCFLFFRFPLRNIKRAEKVIKKFVSKDSEKVRSTAMDDKTKDKFNPS